MGRLAIVTVGIASHVNSCLEAARQLVVAGHDVTFLSPRPRVGEQVGRFGYRFVALDPVPAGHSLPGQAQTPRERARRRALRAEAALAGHGIQRFIADEGADLYLVDSEFNAIILHLLGQGIRPALLDYHLSQRRVAGAPPLSSARIPRSGWRSRLACWRDWELMFLQRRFAELREFRRFGRAAKWPVWRRIASQQSVRLRTVATRRQWPLLYYHDLSYLCFAPAEMCFPEELEAAENYVGPMVLQARKTLESNGDPDNDGITTWLAGRDRRRPLVVCAMGSILSLPDFNARIVTAARGGDFDLLLAVGRGADPAGLGELPENVYAAEYLPLLTTLAHAGVLVHHGGITTAHECIQAGVPMLACSAGLKDEDGTAARLFYHGVALRESVRAPARELRAALERLLTEPGFGDKLAELREHSLAYAREGRLAARVAELLGAQR